jgi:hypothetical protein
MALGAPNTKNGPRGSQNPLEHEDGHLYVNMVEYYMDVSTRYYDYGSSQNVVGLESPPPLETPLHIEI